jgi:hypothetical protein
MVDNLPIADGYRGESLSAVIVTSIGEAIPGDLLIFWMCLLPLYLSKRVFTKHMYRNEVPSAPAGVVSGMTAMQK